MQDVLPCLMLPLFQKNIFLPSAAVAEIITFEKPKPIMDVPNWLLGIGLWRGVQVPLVDLEKVESHLIWQGSVMTNEAENKRHYVALINRTFSQKNENKLTEDHRYPFFSIILKGVPKVHRITFDGVKAVAKQIEGDPRFIMEVKVQNSYALIPDLGYLWQIIDALPSRLQWFRKAIL